MTKETKLKKPSKSRKLSISPEQELAMLRSIVEITNSSLELEIILKDVVKVMTDTTKADSVFIYLFDDHHKNLVLLASKTPHKHELGKVNLKVGEGIAGWVVQKNKVVAIESNASKDKRFKTVDALPEDKYEAILSVPVVYKNKPIGVVNIQHKKAHVYEESTVDLITLITKQISGVIRSATLYRETKEKALQFDSIIKVSDSVTSEGYLDEILNLIVVVTAEMLNSKICSVMIVDKKKGELQVLASQSLSASYKNRPGLKISNSISGQAILTKKPVVITNVQEEKKFVFKNLAEKENLTSMVAIPMVIRDEAIGVINVYMKEVHKFKQEEIDVLQIIANQAATAIQNTKLVEEALKAKDALETRKLVERAKGILMKMNNLTEDAAYRLIHKKSMDSCRTMKEIAESILIVEEFKQ
jgi:signal transduction protein with GAF and PtsI domain